MKKIALLAYCLMTGSLAFATPAPVSCPSTLTCDYAAGKCNNLPSEMWWVYGNSIWDAPEGEQVFQLTKITAFKNDEGMIDDYYYSLTCYYSYPSKDPNAEDVLSLTTNVKSLSGDNWGNHGFGKTYSICNSITPERCTGVEISYEASLALKSSATNHAPRPSFQK